jgi:Zn finger protein HypA/HybF involved in hydrogenase expression
MAAEIGVVQALVCDLLRQLKCQGVRHVAEIRFRRSSAFSEEALKQAYYGLVHGTPLQDARLVIETVNLNHRCHCGHEQVITSADLVGNLFVCPDCGTILEVDPMQGLQIVKVIAAPQAHVHI